jgi:hypothetical protein
VLTGIFKKQDYRMKYLSVVFFTLFIAGCHNDSETPTGQLNPKLGDLFEVKIGTSVVIQNEQLNFRFIDVRNDSRCPEGAECVWAGNAAVIIKIIDVVDTLNTDLSPKEITYLSYQIALTKLSPVPKINVPIDTTQYVAQFVVTKR